MSSCSVALFLLNKRQGFAKDSTVYKNDLLLLKQANEWIIRGIDKLKKRQLNYILAIFFVAIDALVESQWKEKK